jgi:hypothetical protein
LALITIVLVTKVIYTNETCVAFAFETTKPNKEPSNTYSILTSIQIQHGNKNCETFMRSGRMSSMS